MLKRILKCTVLCLILFTTVTVNALEKDSSTLYVKTDATKEFNDFAEDSLDRFLVSQDSIADFSNIYLGSGIKVFFSEQNNNYYIYPVLKNNLIIATIHVSQDQEGFSATYTSGLAEELEAIKNYTSPTKPLALIRQGSCFYAEIGNARYVLEYQQIDLNKTYIDVYEMPDINTDYVETVNVFENKKLNSVINNIVPKYGPVYKMSWESYEIQPMNKPWCASVTTSNIVNNIEGEEVISSADVRSYLGDNDGLTNFQVYNYLRKNGYPSTKYTNSGSLSLEVIMGEISGNCPVFAHFEDSEVGHAIAVFGYNSYTNIYYIHNPLNSYTEMMTIGSTYASYGRIYKWTGGAVYNIR